MFPGQFALGLAISVIIAACEAQQNQYSVENDTYLGTVVKLTCTEGFWNESEYVWLFRPYEEYKLLSVNTTLVGPEADLWRYILLDNGSILVIQNAVKDNEGEYACGRKRIFDEVYFIQFSGSVEIASYLPAVNYPECSIEPDTRVIVGSNVTFTCVAGQSSPQVSLRLILHKDSAFSIYLGDENTTIQVDTAEHNDTMFICTIISPAFPNAQRRCSLGPLIVLPASPIPQTTEKSTLPLTADTMTANTMTADTMSAHEQTTTEYQLKESQPGHTEQPTLTAEVSYIPIVISLVTIALVAIGADIFLLWKVFQLKSQLSFKGQERACEKQGFDGPYMELQKIQDPSKTQAYMELRRKDQREEKDNDSPQQDTGEYENINKTIVSKAQTGTHINVE